MPPSTLLLPVLFVLITVCTSALAQTNRIFQWQFGNNALSTSLPTCTSFQIIVKPFNATLNNTYGVPPYYMMAFATGGIPSTTLIGSDNTSLSWTVTEPVGTQLMLSVVDSTGSAGGIPPQLYQVIAGQTTQCVVAPQTTPGFTVTSNVTGSLTTCQPWGLSVKGGAPPYNLTLAALNSPVVTNVTIPYGFDHFTYIDRADPNGQLLAAISDVTGRWATGTPLVSTKGSANVDCVGLVSSPGNSTIIQQQQQKAASASNKKKTSIIVGVVVSLGVLLLFGVVAAVFFFRRRRQRQEEQQEIDADLFKPQQFIVESEMQRDSTNGVSSLGTSILSEKRRRGLPMVPSSSHATSDQGDVSSTVVDELGDSSRSQSSSDRGVSGFANFSAQPTQRSAKSPVENSFSIAGPSDSGRPDSSGSEPGSHTQGLVTPDKASLAAARGPNLGGPRRMGSRQVLEGTAEVVETEPGEGETIFQHRDAGVVRELPPPYMDSRNQPGNTESS